jgi:hypothetical protein
MFAVRRRSRALAALLALAPLAALGWAQNAAAATPPAQSGVGVTAAFGRGATLGAPTALNVDLRLDQTRLTEAQLTEISFAYPRSLGLISSGLGLAACTRPARDFARVLVEGPRLGGCSPNAVLGYGTAVAIVRLTNGQVIPEYATVTLLAGPFEHGRLGLVVYVDGQRPFGAKLAFAGEVSGAPAPYGGALAMRMPVIPGIEQLATVSLVRMRISIGSPAIRYYEHRGGRTVGYHPDGVELPSRCPRDGFHFRVQVGFADGTRGEAATTAPCPTAVASPPTRR